MKSLTACITILATSFASCAVGATISLEIASERGVQATAPQEWLQLLNRVGVRSARIRGARASDQPDVETIESRAGDIYRVTGVLTSEGRLALPGGVFRKSDATKLRDYFDRLLADGPESLTAVTGNFGLTRPQFEAVFRALSQPLAIDTEGMTTARLIDRARPRLEYKIVVSRAATIPLQAGESLDPGLGKLTIGAALSVALKQRALGLTPVKPRGSDIQLHVTTWEADAELWPVGYEVKGAPRRAAPSLMQSIPVEIDGYSLAAATAAITPRLKVPIFWDHAALSQHGIDPTKIDVRLPRSKMTYKRILDKLLFQARLRGSLRTDEAGVPFYWISR